ncbi:Asp-tRNA(Asn)/Glu-tRNA(Gln) amidotransferase GatCAB subunit A [Bhargavaea cecembensis]|uniref:Asp-tRNA(Asn)/Glu-tRNA(Gln) amidotransferase GatCAB subunit A n=1 Tax=Bhargavaea cecembensis TaxID=394098 RepID=UPI00058F8CA1|nr:Asp-tRNA(Asn)/Glu-tRNA(Gln) amidotransferase GatCAB subunit A [Bhargavaea cecembensis]
MKMTDAIRGLAENRFSPLELVREALDATDRLNGELNALITVCEEQALQDAGRLTREWEAGRMRGPLHGIPVVVKDMIDTEGVRTTMGSKIFESRVPAEDATVVRKLKDAGAVIIGKANTHEFAYGPTGDVSHFGPVRNPFDPSKISGGSSSGSAAAVASGMAIAGIGTDTGGSVRIPASACGLVGMKPTFGRISKHGIFPLADTLDHPGPLTEDVRSNAILLNILAGHDSEDPHSMKADVPDFTAQLGQDVRGMKIGLPAKYFSDVDPEVEQAVRQAAERFEQKGAQLLEADIPALPDIWHHQMVTIQSEAAAVHRQLMEERPDDYAPEVLGRLKDSIRISAWQYVQTLQARRSLVHSYNEVFDEVDVLLTPTLPILPTDIGQREVTIRGKELDVVPSLLRLTSPTNFTGNPSLSLPCGFSGSGLPIGMQLIGRHGEEAKLYRFGHALEQQ